MRKYVVLLALVLSACVNPRAIMVNPEGNEVTCQATGFGLLSGTMAQNAYNTCVSDAQMRGYHFKASQ
jgi:hypothetical protein